MPDPDTLTGMQEAAARIADAMQRSETVAIFGDYDVDGATSSALLARYLRHFGLDPVIHIPDRLFEGYGPNVDAIRGLAERGATLLVTVDCGTTSIEPLTEARSSGSTPWSSIITNATRVLPARAGDRESEPARRSFGAQSSRRGRASCS